MLFRWPYRLSASLLWYFSVCHRLMKGWKQTFVQIHLHIWTKSVSSTIHLVVRRWTWGYIYLVYSETWECLPEGLTPHVLLQFCSAIAKFKKQWNNSTLNAFPMWSTARTNCQSKLPHRPVTIIIKQNSFIGNKRFSSVSAILQEG